jgi:hypothetical protein
MQPTPTPLSSKVPSVPGDSTGARATSTIRGASDNSTSAHPTWERFSASREL